MLWLSYVDAPKWYTTIASDNGLSPVRRQTIIRTNAVNTTKHIAWYINWITVLGNTRPNASTHFRYGDTGVETCGLFNLFHLFVNSAKTFRLNAPSYLGLTR